MAEVVAEALWRGDCLCTAGTPDRGERAGRGGQEMENVPTMDLVNGEEVRESCNLDRYRKGVWMIEE